MRLERIDFSRMTVGVFDPDPQARKILLSILRILRCRYVLAKAPADILRPPDQPDLLLLGLSPDGEDTRALDITRTIRTGRNSPNPFVPVIIMASRVTPATVAAARDAGMSEFVSRPLSVGRLGERIAHALEKPRSFAAGESYFGPDRRRREGCPVTRERRAGKSGEAPPRGDGKDGGNAPREG